jgi:hypothetical protein
MIYARPDVFDVLSAQEGGYLLLDRGKNRDTLMVYLDDSMIMVKRANRSEQLDVEFGTEDRAFLLQRDRSQELCRGRKCGDQTRARRGAKAALTPFGIVCFPRLPPTQD